MDTVFTASGDNYSVRIACDEHSARIDGGRFGTIAIEPCDVFKANLKNPNSDEIREIGSTTVWKTVRLIQYDESFKLYFSDPDGIEQLMFAVEGICDDVGISWSVSVINDNLEWSVFDVNYPIPKLNSDHFDLFVPDGCGLVIKNAGNKGYKYKRRYPGGYITMQYFAVYNDEGGVYLGIEDGKGSTKEFTLSSGNGVLEIVPRFYGINASSPANSFSLAGHCRWEYIKGDWYDATMLYAAFVHSHADWLPKIEKDGRPDTAKRFKEIPFWICDYVPNSPSQGNNKPMSLSAGSDLYAKDYWITAAIELQKRLGVPVAYHVYNWHEIPFNIEYPHFLPAKKEFIEGAKKLREHPIYVFPYINAGSWEIHDAEMGHPENFENVGKHGAAIKSDGSYVLERYPQTTLKGETSLLANMCPSSHEWQTTVCRLVREMESTLPIDGIYFDQIGAINASPCFNSDHGHLPGGGSHWAEGYRLLMEKVSAEKPDDFFYFTEDNAETYTKSFDGFLSWYWVKNGQVPAFPAIYAGYIEMLGRCTIGKKKEDYDFFKFHTAESLLFGQQLGWHKADMVYDEKRMAFLTKAVQLRYHYTELFHVSDLLRPPTVIKTVPPKITPPALSHKDEITMEQISAGAWRYRNGEKLVLISYNIAETDEAFTLSFSAEEYGLDAYELPEDFVIENGICSVSGVIPAESFKVWELTKKEDASLA